MPVYMEHRHPQHDDICNLDRYVHLCQIADCVILKAEIPVHSPMVSFCAGPAVVYSLKFAGIPRYIVQHSWILADLQPIYIVLVLNIPMWRSRVSGETKTTFSKTDLM